MSEPAREARPVAEPLVTRERYAVYRKMMNHPAISSARAEILGELLRVQWLAEVQGPRESEVRAVVERFISRQATTFLVDCLGTSDFGGILDFGFAAFEVVWGDDEFGNTAIDFIRPLYGPKTRAYLDTKNGSFAGLLNWGQGFHEEAVDIDNRHAVWICTDNHLYYGVPRLEGIRGLWQTDPRGEIPASGVQRALHDGYCGGPSQTHAALTAGDIAFRACRALNKICANLIYQNFGKDEMQNAVIRFTQPTVTTATPPAELSGGESFAAPSVKSGRPSIASPKDVALAYEVAEAAAPEKSKKEIAQVVAAHFGIAVRTVQDNLKKHYAANFRDRNAVSESAAIEAGLRKKAG